MFTADLVVGIHASSWARPTSTVSFVILDSGAARVIEEVGSPTGTSRGIEGILAPLARTYVENSSRKNVPGR